jgi:uncharacterized protein DUF326
MTTTQEMLRTHPLASIKDGIAECIEATYECAQVCSICADACLSEQNVADMRRCIGMNLNCATICHATGEMLTRESVWDPSMVRAQLQACIEACRMCADECQHHASHMEHCRVCAEECRRCEEACRHLLQQI